MAAQDTHNPGQTTQTLSQAGGHAGSHATAQGWAMFADAPAEGVRADEVRRTLLRWLARGSLGGLAISVLIHVVLTLILAFVTVNRGGADAGGAGNDQIEFALGMDDAPSAMEMTAPSTPTVQSTGAAVPMLEPLVEMTGGTDSLSDADLAELAVNSASGGRAGPNASDPSVGSSSGTGAGASFFGLEAEGKRFAYIVDVSSSMRGDAFGGRSRIAVTKSELNRSVSALIESGEYLIMLYAGDAAPLHGRERWTPATEANKLATRKRVGLIDLGDRYSLGISSDGTKPLTAFRQVFQVRPRPDAIYFMTDGEFQEPDVPEQIARMNARYKIPIHCILFTDPDSPVRARVEPEMLRISRESGGRYTLVSGVTP